MAVRVAQVADDAALFLELAGREAVVETLRARAGRAFDPAVVDAFVRHAEELLAPLAGESVWDGSSRRSSASGRSWPARRWIGPCGRWPASPTSSPSTPSAGTFHGRDASTAMLEGYMAAFSNIRREVVDLIECGDAMVAELRVSAEHTGSIPMPDAGGCRPRARPWCGSRSTSSGSAATRSSPGTPTTHHRPRPLRRHTWHCPHGGSRFTLHEVEGWTLITTLPIFCPVSTYR
jgi:hypothetical protein